ncbi:hypothetical protein [Streptomyces albidoflavus]|uniref:hypothetical protein n=1 Tax=Streptomyces albidoflavus TaxID=1886 RepID=UPI003CEB7159
MHRKISVPWAAAAILFAAAHPAAAQPARPEVFYTGGDAAHISSTPPRTASGHGWWVDKNSIGTGDSPNKLYTPDVKRTCSA